MGKSKKLNRKRKNVKHTMSGGQVPVPAPVPAGLNIYALDETSLRTSLQSFGDTLQSLYDIATTDQEVTGSIIETLEAQQTASDSLVTAVSSLFEAFRGDEEYITSSGTSGTRGLYRALLGLNRTFTPPPFTPPPSAQVRTAEVRQRIAEESYVRTPTPAPRPASA